MSSFHSINSNNTTYIELSSFQGVEIERFHPYTEAFSFQWIEIVLEGWNRGVPLYTSSYSFHELE